MFAHQQILHSQENHDHRTFFDMLQYHQIPTDHGMNKVLDSSVVRSSGTSNGDQVG